MATTLVGILGIVGATVVGCLCAMAGQLHERRKWEQRILAQAGFRVVEPLPTPARIRSEADDRLERLEQSVEAIAVEMERVGEGQRFVTKLLAERRPDRPPTQPPGSVRPPYHVTPT